MLRLLLVSWCLALLRVCNAQSSSGGSSSSANNSFIYPPPPKSGGTAPIFQIGDTINAKWSSNFSSINLVLWTDFTMSDGNQNIIRLMSNERNENAREFLVGGNIGLDQGSKFYLEVLETDSSNDGKETGNRFRTEDFDITPSTKTSAPPTITQTLQGTTIVISPSSTPQTTASSIGTGTAISASATAAPTTTGTGAPASDTGGMTQGAKVGVGVGVGVGVPIAIAVAGALLYFLRRRSRRDKNAGDGVGIAHGREPTLGVSREKPVGGDNSTWNDSSTYRS